MAELAMQGLGVSMESPEFPEMLGVSDRAFVTREGQIVAELLGSEIAPDTLVRHATGIGAAKMRQLLSSREVVLSLAIVVLLALILTRFPDLTGSTYAFT